ncbi:MAG TPA: GumC family protein, partial [Pseudolabrys sp.]|nr:GumC family protein [Pseudolabrys sp.]
MILGLTLLSAAAAYLVVNTITPRYRSESRLLLEARENVFMRAEADKSAGTLATIDPEAVTSQIQVVLSRDLAREVIKKENLASNPEFDPIGSVSLAKTLLGLLGIGRDPSTMSQDERILEAYYDRLNVFAIEKSRVIAVDFSSANPELAARVANAVAENYLGMQQSAKQDQTRAAGNWLAVEIDKMRKKVEEAEAKVEEYRVKSNLFVGSNNSSLPNQQLTEINSQISAARGQKADLEARARQLRDQVRSGKPVESSDIANSDSMRRLVEQRVALRSQLAEQSSTLLDQHPRIKELKAQIAEVDRQIKVDGERLARQLDNDAAVAGNRVETLSASLDQVKKLASQSNEQDVQLRALEREAKTQRDLLESYLAKYREASARDNINAAPPEARIISRATPAIKPAYPKKLPTVLIAAFAAFALSAGFTVTGALLGPAPSAGYAYG